MIFLLWSEMMGSLEARQFSTLGRQQISFLFSFLITKYQQILFHHRYIILVMTDIQNSFQQTLTHLLKLKQIISSSPNLKTIYLVYGDEKAGKRTFIHYLLGSPLQFETDEEGQDVINLVQEQTKTHFNDVLPQIYSNEDESVFYLRLPTFDQESRSNYEKFERQLCLDFIFESMKNVTIKLLLLITIGSDAIQALTLFRQAFERIENFENICSIVLTKLYDEEEKHEFVEQTINDIVETHEEFDFLQKIAENDKVFCFYCEEIDEDKRTELSEALDSLEVDKVKLLSEKISLKLEFESDEVELIMKVCRQKGKNWVQLINKSILVSCRCLSGVNLSKSQPELKEMEEILQANFDQTLSLMPMFEKNYQNLSENDLITKIQQLEFIKTSLQEQQFSKLNSYQPFSSFLNEINTNQTFSSLIPLLFAVPTYLQAEEQIFNFTPLVEGSLSNEALGSVYKKEKEKFSEQFREEYGKALEETGKTGKVKRKKQKKKKVISYEEQKKNAGNNIVDHFKLPISPLKIDLYMDFLKRDQKSKEKSRQAILDEKIIIKKLSQMLQIYEKVEQAITISCIIPDFNRIQVLMQVIIEKYKKDDEKREEIQTRKQKQEKLNFIKGVASFCYENRRTYIIKPCLPYITKMIGRQQATVFEEDLDELAKRHNEKKVFMNYDIAEKLFDDQKNLVKECIDYEKANMESINIHLRINYLLEKLLPWDKNVE